MNVIHHLSRIKGNYHVIISMDSEKALDKIREKGRGGGQRKKRRGRRG